MPKLGAFSPLKETKMNWYGTLAVDPLYWNVLLDGKRLVMPPNLIKAGKVFG